MSSDETEIKRQAALARYEIVGTPAEESFNRFVRVAVQSSGMPIALVTFVDSDRQWLKAKRGVNLQWTKRDHGFCNHTILEDDVFIVNDASQDDRFRDNPVVCGHPHIRFYAGAPIITADGYRIGSMCVLSPEPHQNFDAASRQLLKDLAQSVMTELELRRVNREQAKISANLAFWNRFSHAIASALNFDAALEQTLSFCAERTGAAACSIAEYHPTYDVIEYVKTRVAPGHGLNGLDVSKWAGSHPKGTLSFGIALSNGHISDGLLAEEIKDSRHSPLIQEMSKAGICRQLVYPFDLAERRFGLVLDFECPDIGQDTQSLAQEFTARLVPLLMGRLREDALDRSNRTLRMIHASTEAFARAGTPEALFNAACQLAVEIGGYDACWIGLAGNDPERLIRFAASAGRSIRSLSKLRLTWMDEPDGRGPTGTAIREKKVVLLVDLVRNEGFARWRDKALASGFRSCISLPFGLDEGPATGAFTLYSSNQTAFEDSEQGLLIELTANLTKALKDLTTRQERDAALMAGAMSEQKIDRLLTATGTVLYTLKLIEGRAVPVEISRSILDMLGYAPEDIRGSDWWRSHVHPEDLPQAELGIAHTCDGGHYVHRYRIRHRNGSYRWIRDELTLQRDASGQPSGIAGVWMDITEHRAAEEEIYRLAFLDPLTGLPNRRLLNERLGTMLSEARCNGLHGALLFIDLDRFKNINDMLGHTAGDAALTEAARRLRLAIRATDTIARIGGDEFVVLLAEAGNSTEAAAAHATRVGRKIIDAVTSRPVLIEGQKYHLGASIGFTLFPKPADTIDTLVREADTAMYQAKAGPRNVVMFQPVMHQSIVARHVIEDEIREALADRRFEVWLQDQVNDTGTAVSAEVLVRLRGRDGSVASPAEFIGVAESSGLIIQLGRWLLREACSILSRVGSDQPGYGLSVNVSPRQFHDPDFVSDVLSALDVFGVAPERLTLEITEGLLIQDTLEIARIMGYLADRGVRFSVDDFGTGYSSLHYLRHLPIHELKIDRSFIAQLPEDTSSGAIVEAILAMAHRLDLDVVAEGVETVDHVAFLRARGRMRMQGFFFSEPLNVTAWFKQRLNSVVPDDL